MEAVSITSELGATTATHRRGEVTVDHEFVAAFVEQQAAVLRLAVLLCGDRRQAEDVVAEAFARTYPQWRRGTVDNLGASLRRDRGSLDR